MNREHLRDAARDYLTQGFSILPLDEDKKPTVETWKWEPNNWQTHPMKLEEVEHWFSGSRLYGKLRKKTQGLGIVCGAVSGSLEVVDVDTKHDKTGRLWEDFSDLIRDEFKDRAEEFLIVMTRSGGVHIYYRSEALEGNKRLARDGSTGKVLIETRGEGGYVVAPPSIGYELLQGSYDSIPTLTQDERDTLHGLALRFHTGKVKEQKYTAPRIERGESSGLRPGDDYNQRGDVVALLERHGWKVVNHSGPRVDVLRPGQTDSKTSGNFHETLRTLWIWSSSTEFEPEEPYSPFAAYALLECGNDFSEAARRLRAEGYGDKTDRRESLRGDVMPESIQAEPVPVEGLRVDLETREGEKLTLRREGLLTQKDVGEAKAYRVRLYYTEHTEPEHVSGAVKLLLGLPSVSVLVAEVADLDTLEGYAPEAESSGPVFLYDSVREPYQGRELAAGEQQRLLEELVEASWSIKNPLELDRYKNVFKNDEGLLEELGISFEAWEKTVDRLNRERRSKEREAELKTLTLHVQDLTAQGRAKDAITALEQGLLGLRSEEGSELVPPFRDWETLKREIAETQPGLRTGYPALNKFVSFAPGALTLVAGRPSHGKTALLLNFCVNIAQDEEAKKGPVYFFTYEEPSKNLATKLLNILQGQDLKGLHNEEGLTSYEFLKRYIREPEAYPAARRHLAEAEEKLKGLIDSRAIVLVDAARYTVEDLEALVTYQAREENVRAVIVDYVQRLNTTERTQDQRTKVGHISDVLLRTAISTELPFIVGAQLNRGAADAPTLENLKEAGDLEEDANTVLSVFNPHRADTVQEHTTERTVELTVRALKNREGEVNRKAVLVLDKWTQKITDLTDTVRRGF